MGLYLAQWLSSEIKLRSAYCTMYNYIPGDSQTSLSRVWTDNRIGDEDWTVGLAKLSSEDTAWKIQPQMIWALERANPDSQHIWQE